MPPPLAETLAATPESSEGSSSQPLLSLPPLRRPAPPPGSPLAASRPQPSPKTTMAKESSPARTWLNAAGGAASISSQTLAEVQVLLARLRGALLRRPRGGNWVQAFARHDKTGAGLLGCAQFEAFLTSLSLGLSTREVRFLAESLAGPGSCGVSLGAFSEAITHAEPSDERFGEPWALDIATALAGSAQGGLASFVGRADCEAAMLLAFEAEVPVVGETSERFRLWLPKTPDGAIDWAAAEEWRTGGSDPCGS